MLYAVFASTCCFHTKIRPRVSRLNVIFISVFLILVFISTFKLLGHDRDYNNYYNWFSYVENIQGETKEISFLFLRYIVHNFLDGSITILFFFYAVSGVFSKLFAIKKYSSLPYLSLFLYLSMYFPLHEYTQIRVGVAAGLILLSIPDLVRNRSFIFLFKIGLATMFHWSAAYAVFPYFLISFFSLRFIFVLPFLGLFFSLLKAQLLIAINKVVSFAPFLSYYYSTHSGHDDYFNVFNILFLMNLCVWFVIYFLSPKCVLFTKNIFSVSFVFFSFSIFSYLLFAFLGKPVISFRLYELLNVSLLLLLPWFVCFFKQKRILTLVVVMYGVINMYHLLFDVNIFPNFSMGTA